MRVFMSTVGGVAALLLLVVWTVAGIVSAFGDSSSTAALALLWFPLWALIGVVLAAAADVAVRAAARRMRAAGSRAGSTA